YLKNAVPGTVRKEIKWDFTTSKIDRNSKVIERFAPQTSKKKKTAAIESVL
ncbi:glutathione peroxidase, partial [Enterococcus faecium]|nr:glutathione peroxidase [Enterococcus faecium]